MVASQVLWVVLLVVILLVFVVLPLAGFARIGWRVFRNDEQMEPGGPLSRQMFGRVEKSRRSER